jgi:shikimate dehydrogenase
MPLAPISASDAPLSGASRVHFIVGDPVAQVKSPAGVSLALQAAGHNAYVLPAHVAAADLKAWLAGVSLAKNVDGIIVTVPHKFACFELCATTSPSAQFLRTVNTLRRNTDGSWHGDMFDGLSFVAALRAQGCQLAGKTALLVGAGGAGTAIAHALVMAGVSALALADTDQARRTTLADRLASLGLATISCGSGDPRGYDIVINATPMGMQAHDPLPIATEHLSPAMVVGCVVTVPAVTPLIAAARQLGCVTVTGTQMFAMVRDLMVAFLTAPPDTAA